MSPLRPGQRARYPLNWREVRAEVLERAGQRCECRGECGSVHGFGERRGRRCSAPNRAEIWREHEHPERWHPAHVCPESLGLEEEGEAVRLVRVVLTVAHLDHAPENCALENLRAFCQRCHLRYDASEHAKHAATTRHARRATGDLFENGEAT